MQRLVVTLKDPSKQVFLLELLTAFDFLSVEFDLGNSGEPRAAPVGSIPATNIVKDYRNDLAAGYEAMAADEQREMEALEWMEGTLNHEEL